MTDDTNKRGVDEEPAAKTVDGEATHSETMSGAFAGEVNENSEDDLSPLDQLIEERDEMKDKYLRLAAEMDNLRRRTAREVRDAKSYSVANFARDMLAVSDNLRRALDAIPDETREGSDAGLKALIEGVEMTERLMLSTLERHGVKKLSPNGEKFDPNFHQAMFEVPNPDVPNNTVVEVVQDGFVIGERVLRPAMVGVAKGGAKAGANASAEPQDEQAD
ncbi:MAG: nucleotide exchange factor GrpE [Rhizobiaceae bacterium]|nr:nucleotide exchange factor GrpE [Rhizobiaceae bacterium]